MTTSRNDIKIYDESDRCPLCHKQPDESNVDCEMCNGSILDCLCPNCSVEWEEDSDEFGCWKCGYDKKTGKVHKIKKGQPYASKE